MEFILPDLSNSLNIEIDELIKNIEVAYNDLVLEQHKISAKKFKQQEKKFQQKLIDLLSETEYNELLIINKVNYYDSNTCEKIVEKCINFYENIIECISNKKKFDKKELIDKINKHKTDIYEILYLNIINLNE